MDAAAKAAAGVNPSALAAGESGAIGAASIAAQLRAAEAAQAAATAAAKQADTLAAFKAKEAADAAVAKASAAQQDYDEKFRIRSMQGVMSASSGSGFKGLTAGGATNVTVNVAGSVTSENDLVATVRNGLLRGQYNGQGLTLEAI
jgi:FKBP-type peptidyl-prolyl cis-trans isomerase